MKSVWIMVMLLGWHESNRFVEASVPATSKPLWNATYSDSLKKNLLMTYDKFLRPTEHFNKTSVKLAQTFIHVGLDEVESVFQVHSLTRMSWTDDKLKWNASDYGNLTVIHLAPHEVWQPDISLYNSASGNNVDWFGSTHLLVHNDGTVLWVPPTIFRVFCALDLHYWPFDTHECSLILGSWVFDGRQMDLELHGEGFDMQDLILPKNEWQITKITAVRNTKNYTCCEEPYIDITYTVALERSSSMYRTVITVPAIVVIFLTLATFWLPTHYGEKILLNGVNAMIIVMYLIYFAQKLNVMAFNTPLIVTFYSNTMYMVCFSTLIAVVVINLSRVKHNCAVPWYIKKHLDGPLERFLFLQNIYSAQPERQLRGEELRDPPFDEQITSDDHHIIQQSRGDKGSLQHEWIKLAAAIDRIAFIVYTITFALSALIYSI